MDYHKSIRASHANPFYHGTDPLSHVNILSLIDFVSNFRVPLGMRLRGSSPAISPGMASYHSMR